MNDETHVSGSSDRTIIFVHGCGFKPSRGDYLDGVVAAFAAGVEKDMPDLQDTFASVNKALAYYGDLSNEFLADGDDVYDEVLDTRDRLDTLHQMKSLDRKKGFSVRNYDKLPGKSALEEFAASALAPVLAVVGIQKRIVSKMNKDLGEYWRLDSTYRSAVLARVRETICAALDRNEHVMLVSHSTGSIVTYDALWQLSHDPDFCESFRDAKIDAWLTLGSPLGDSMVRKQLLGARRKGRERFPTNILAWHNVSAEDDYVAHDQTVADDFRAMMKQRQVSSIRDYRIYNLAVRYGRSDPHCSIGYLFHPRVIKTLTDWLTKAYGRPMPKHNP
jgi:hypothetical protein